MKSPVVLLAVILATASAVWTANETSPGPPPSACGAPEFRQFDFWIGQWDLTWADSGRGTNTITLELDSCVVVENFSTRSSPPFVGRSVSVFDRRIEKWRQTWVDNQGGYLDFVGGMVGDSMILARETRHRDSTFHQRMVFYDIAADSLNWNWERSDDTGITWSPLWRIHYVRRR